MTHRGSCHCGKVRFTVEGDLEQVIECNCSHCVRCLEDVDLASVKRVPVDGRSY